MATYNDNKLLNVSFGEKLPTVAEIQVRDQEVDAALEELRNGLNVKADASVLTAYAKIEDLDKFAEESELTAYALSADVEAIAATKADLSDLTDLTGYVKEDMLTAYARIEDLPQYDDTAKIVELSTKIDTSTRRIKAALPDFDDYPATAKQAIDEVRTFLSAFIDAEAVPFGDGNGGAVDPDEISQKIIAQKPAIDALVASTPDSELSSLRTTVNSIITILQNIVA